ncbi:MAG: hypothetical protein GF418_04195 [Chitinivibrionales bacterium]|nr:hypothetical protein [Chitinivibrionales bacterium]MBD3394808.1 hypothetical protein [Chitinivibrionales bacterium]
MEAVVSACRTIFGSPFFVSQSIVDWLQPQDVAVAFQRAIEKHVPPGVDILRDGGRLHVPTIRRFIRAYQVLTRFLEERDANGRSAGVVLNHCHGRRQFQSSHAGGASEREATVVGGRLTHGDELYYDGSMIPTRLRFGSYLYYRGLISYEMLSDALEWQKRRRPLMGQIAMKSRFLSPADFAQVLFYLRVGESFGKVAVEHGKLTHGQVNKIASVQKKFNSRIGTYFVENGILSEGIIERCFTHFCAHNELYAE